MIALQDLQKLHSAFTSTSLHNLYIAEIEDLKNKLDTVMEENEILEKIDALKKCINTQNYRLSDLKIFQRDDVAKFLLLNIHITINLDEDFKKATLKFLTEKLESNTFEDFSYNNFMENLDEVFNTRYCIAENSTTHAKTIQDIIKHYNIQNGVFDNKFVINSDFIDIDQFKLFIENDKIKTLRYFFNDDFLSLYFLYNNANKAIEFLEKIDYTSTQQIFSSLQTTFGNYYDSNGTADSKKETDFWHSFNNKDNNDLALFFSRNLIKQEKPAEYNKLILIGYNDNSNNQLIELKNEIIHNIIPTNYKLAHLVAKYQLSLEDMHEFSQLTHKTADNLPNINFELQNNGQTYTFAKMSPGDVNGLFLGYYTNSCQSIGKDGSICAKQGFERADCTFYVLKKGATIVAQFYAWQAEGGGIVLDSYESRPEEKVMLIDILKGFKEILGESTELFVGTGGGTPKLNIDSIPGPKPLNKDLLPYYDSNTVYKIENVNSIALSNELNILLNNNIYTITQQIYTIEDYYSSLHNQGVDLTYFRPRYMLELESAYPGVAGKILKIPNLLHELHLKHQRLSINQVMNGIKQANDDQIQMLVEICGNAQEPISLINSAHIFD